jgi:hypothetical protein
VWRSNARDDEIAGFSREFVVTRAVFRVGRAVLRAQIF